MKLYRLTLPSVDTVIALKDVDVGVLNGIPRGTHDVHELSDGVLSSLGQAYEQALYRSAGLQKYYSFDVKHVTSEKEIHDLGFDAYDVPHNSDLNITIEDYLTDGDKTVIDAEIQSLEARIERLKKMR